MNVQQQQVAADPQTKPLTNSRADHEMLTVSVCVHLHNPVYYRTILEEEEYLFRQ